MAIDNYTPSFKEPNGLLSEPLTPTANSEGAFQVTIPSDFDFSDISSGGYWNATGALLEDVIIIRQFNNSTIKIGAGDLWRAWTYSDEKSGSMISSVDGMTVTFSTVALEFDKSGGGTVVLPAISAADTVYVLRKTATKAKMVTFSPSAKVTSSSLNLITDQVFQIGQELEAMWMNFTKINPAYGTPGGVCPLGADGTVDPAYSNALLFNTPAGKYQSSYPIEVPVVGSLDGSGNIVGYNSNTVVNHGWIDEQTFYGTSATQMQMGSLTLTSSGDPDTTVAGTDMTYTLPFTAASENNSGFFVEIDGIAQRPCTDSPGTAANGDFDVTSTTEIKIFGTTNVGDIIQIRNSGVARNLIEDNPIITGNLTVSGNIGGKVLATGQNIARTLQDRFADVINVKDYGATGDGTTNDRAAIDAALADANTKWEDNENIVLYFPPGDYNAKGLTGNPYLTLESNPDNSKWTGRPTVIGHGARLIDVGIEVNESYTNISGLKFSRDTADDNFAEHAILISEEPAHNVGPYYVSINNCIIEGYNTGIYWPENDDGKGSSECIVTECIVRDCTIGMYSNETVGINVSNSIFNHNSYGMKIDGAGSLKLTGCTLSDNDLYGLYMVSVDALADSRRIFESYFVNSTFTGNGKDSSLLPITAIVNDDGKAKITVTGGHEVPLNGYISTSYLMINGIKVVNGSQNIKVLAIEDENTLTLDVDYDDLGPTDAWTKINWDVYIDGTDGFNDYNVPDGSVYNLFFTGCNINTLRLEKTRHIRFVNCKLVQNIHMAGTCQGISFIGAWTTDGTKDNTPLLPSGPAAGNGWSEISSSFLRGDFNTDTANIRVPSITPNVDNGGTPTSFAGPSISKDGVMPDILDDNQKFSETPAGQTFWVRQAHVNSPNKLKNENWWICSVIGNTPNNPSVRYIIAYGYNTNLSPKAFTGSICLGAMQTSLETVEWTYLTTHETLPFVVDDNLYYRHDVSTPDDTTVMTYLTHAQTLGEVPGGSWYYIDSDHPNSPDHSTNGAGSTWGDSSVSQPYWMVWSPTGMYNASQETNVKYRYPMFWGMRTGVKFSGAQASCRVSPDGVIDAWSVIHNISSTPFSSETISSGVITLTGLPLIVVVDGEGGTSDNLVTINGGNSGQRLIVKSAHNERDITVKDTGNIYLSSTGDMDLDSTSDLIELIYFTTADHATAADGWYEISRSNNT